ncbi:MAG TPA: ATP-dependent DNA helicase RecG [Anaeromyxobacteraceae bacterium]|nr:ATP-dependent DNA helicase RecG [Anaeromyxobacteraceae bacterium]
MGESGSAGQPAGARELEALIAPLKFAARQDRAGLARLAHLGDTVRGAVARAIQAGAPSSPALERLSAEADAYDRLPPSMRLEAVCRIAGQLAALVPVPPEVADLARRHRVAPGPRPVEAAARTRRSRPEKGPAPAPAPSGPSDRAERRRRLSTPLSSVTGLHPAPRGLLEERGRLTVEAALEFWPKAYQDRSVVRRVADLRPGEDGIAVVAVRSVRQQRMRSGKPMLKVSAGDASGRLELVFFNPPPWRQKQFVAGETLLASGSVSEGYGGVRQMVQPEVEKVAEGDSANFGRIVPFYAGPADYQHPALRKLVKRLCDDFAPWAVDDLPPPVRRRRGLVSRARALAEAHFPPDGTRVDEAAARATPAFRRLVFEEFFFLQLALALKRRGLRREAGIAFDVSEARRAEALAPLPFRLTAAQARAFDEIARDMGRPEPMNRLLQGDVGSGKTAVAFAAMMLAVRSGWQAALMVPTEILAEQHAATLGRWLEGSGVGVALVAAQARGRAQRATREAVRTGAARIAVGTHALLEEDVAFERLGLAVVDEQHRFGVLQRAQLVRKGVRPDVLVMTATPIPRTLALAFYGDLDQSKIDGLPPGRAPVETRAFGDSQRRKAHEIARRELEAGRQVYVVYPLVAESEKTDLADATSGAAELRRILAPFEVGLLHGQMRTEEKRDVMEAFRAGRLRVLVATTVIEVGVDVPNATTMIVEHAERFGLSQLHQLRGRVGRGAAKSQCLLVAHYARAGDEARERLRTMTRSQDGFEIARADLRIRGPGELLGTRQAGVPLLQIADLYRDESILDEAREEAFRLAEEDPGLESPENRAAGEALAAWSSRISLARVG